MKQIFRENEVKYYGIHACLFIAKHRPQDVIKLYLDSSNKQTFSSLMKYCASKKKAYHIVTNQDLDKVSGSVHHEGVCLIAKEKSVCSEKEFFTSLLTQQGSHCILYLDGVQNPHNIGSIMRTCAHFQVKYILGENLSSLSPAACRIAKGGAEICDLVSLESPLKAIRKLLSQGFGLVTTSSHASASLYDTALPKKMILAMGSEDKGVSKELLQLPSSQVQIPGTGIMESLNVSVATGLFIGEFYRQHGARK